MLFGIGFWFDLLSSSWRRWRMSKIVIMYSSKILGGLAYKNIMKMWRVEMRLHRKSTCSMVVYAPVGLSGPLMVWCEKHCWKGGSRLCCMHVEEEGKSSD